jgi:hypothetical protein
MRARGDVAEENFNLALQGITKKPFTQSEKTIFITTLKEFNKVYPNHFTNALITAIKNKNDFGITKVEKVGSTKSEKTKKNDILLTTNLKDPNTKKDFKFGISYKFGDAQTVQSWSTINTWRDIFRENQLKNITTILKKITTLHADAEQDYSVGSTIHLQPLKTHYSMLYKNNKQIIRHIKRQFRGGNIESSENFQDSESYVNFMTDNLDQQEDLNYELNKYVNNVLKNYPQIFHYILFGDKNENCIFYYNEREGDDTSFKNIGEMFERLGTNLFIAGGTDTVESALAYLVDKINVVPRYVFPTRSASNKSNEYLVVWNSGKNKRNLDISVNRDLLTNGSFVSFRDFLQIKNYQQPYLNFTKLKTFYKNNFNINFKGLATSSKKFPVLPECFEDIISSDLPKNLIVLKCTSMFDFFFKIKLFNILSEEDFRKYEITIEEMRKRYKTDSQLNNMERFLRCCLQIIAESRVGTVTTTLRYTLNASKGKIKEQQYTTEELETTSAVDHLTPLFNQHIQDLFEVISNTNAFEVGDNVVYFDGDTTYIAEIVQVKKNSFVIRTDKNRLEIHKYSPFLRRHYDY